MEPNTVIHRIAVVALVLVTACQSAAPTPAATNIVPTATVGQTTASPVTKSSGVPSPSVPAAVAGPSPSAVAAPSPSAAAAAAPPVGSSRVEVLNAANSAFTRGDLGNASQLYERVLNTPPNGESAEQTAAINGLAGFQAVVALLAAGHEDEAKTQLQALQQKDANAPFARLASQLWDQYTMVGGVRGACAQLQPQIAAQAGPTLQALQALGVTVDPQTLCKLPTGSGG
ncbi:MAG: hypothetical protein JO318_07545 [Chloroflexi bacterium]|nr:hypothetical protein [Chloroflexota bacterium]